MCNWNIVVTVHEHRFLKACQLAETTGQQADCRYGHRISYCITPSSSPANRIQGTEQ